MAFWLRDYDRRQQQLAAKKQAEVQTKLINEYTEARYNIQKEIGAATGNPEKIAELQQKVKELDDKYKEDMQATADLRQYIEDEEDDKAVEAGSMEKYLSTKFREGTEAPGEANLRRQAEMHDKQAGDEQKNAQQNFAVANRDYRGEAEKNAVSQAASENAQKVANMGNVSAAASALARGVKSADYNTHMQRQDQQRAEGVKNQREMWGSRQTAEEERANANKERHDYTDAQTYNLASNNLSKGNMFFNDKNAVGTKAKQSPAPEQKIEEPVQEEQPAVEEAQQPEEPNLNGWTMYDVQNAINIVAENRGQLSSAKTNEYISTRKAGADPQQERQKLAPLVSELSSNPEKYEEYAQWLAKERGGNISVNKNTEVQKTKGSTVYPQTDETQQNIANTLEQNSKYN